MCVFATAVYCILDAIMYYAAVDWNHLSLRRSVDEKQRAVAAHCLMSWCMDRTFAREAWLHGSEPLVDLLMENPKVKA